MLDPILPEEKTILHHWNIIPKQKLTKCTNEESLLERKIKIGKTRVPITWTVSDLAKAGCLLSTPPVSSTFEDEQEMRTVYTLIYDVFRYKNILMQALNDISFFQVFPKLLSNIPHIWLLFYDLYHRTFKKRETKVAKVASQLFDTYGLTYAENALWTQRIKLAASVARLRIKHNALSLSELLPSHLKDERVTEQAKNNPVTCWINSLKVSDIKQLCKEIEDSFKLKMVTDVKDVSRNNFRWDGHCPQIIAFHASLRARVTQSTFVKNHLIIIQDKSFCIGPATFGKLIQDLELTGSVIQTHINSPRTTAYLATLLSQNEKIKHLLAFSAGKRKQEYEAYFTELGMSNILIYSDRLIDSPPDANYMEEVVAVFATPPNSYSAVADPIDLVCSRGGDLSMLEVLTESSDTKEARERIAGVLEEQRKTLRFAMSRPQIQFVLYETHSELEVENSSMVNKALNEMNRNAKVQHAILQGKMCAPIEQEPDVTDINSQEALKAEVSEESIIDSHEMVNSEEEISTLREKIIDTIKVPDTDIFNTPSLPILCESENCKNFEKQGCYLALLQRKQIIRLDDKYMIQMAENRGLFGSNTTTPSVKSKTSKASKKKPEKDKPIKPKKKLRNTEIDRIAAPTHTFLRHTRKTEDIQDCKKCIVEDEKSTLYRKWWKDTTRHIVILRRTLIKQKLLAPSKIKHVSAKSAISCFWQNVQRVDEILKQTNLKTQIPVFPKLRLPREQPLPKIQIPLTITSVEFPMSCNCSFWSE